MEGLGAERMARLLCAFSEVELLSGQPFTFIPMGCVGWWGGKRWTRCTFKVYASDPYREQRQKMSQTDRHPLKTASQMIFLNSPLCSLRWQIICKVKNQKGSYILLKKSFDLNFSSL